MSRPERLAFMSGHVEAGLALYRAGDPGAAAPHLLHPVSETHASERAGLDELGFRSDLFEAVSEALEGGVSAEEVEPQLQAAEENLDQLATKAGGDTIHLIRFLMDLVVEEYSVGVTDGRITDPGEFQDAYGFAVVARKRADSLTTDRAEQTRERIDNLLTLWTQGPVPTDSPAPPAQVSAEASRVLLTLPIEE